MDLNEITKISLEGALSVLLLTFAYKVYRARISTESDGHCCKWLNFHMRTDNPGGPPVEAV